MEQNKRTVTVKTIEELNAVFDEEIKKRSVFRGVCKREQMLPKIIRNYNSSKNEITILKEFERYYNAYATVNNFWEFLALAQHHGLKTRLIDFTENPYVALFFSLFFENGNEDEYAVYSLEEINRVPIRLFESINDQIHFLQKIDPNLITVPEENEPFYVGAEKYFEKIGYYNHEYILSVKPNRSSTRMIMQQGLFIVPDQLNKDRVLEKFDNLYCVGRNGQHRYNNMDHSMMTSIEAVRAICGETNKSIIWKVNTEQDYHEADDKKAN